MYVYTFDLKGVTLTLFTFFRYFSSPLFLSVREENNFFLNRIWIPEERRILSKYLNVTYIFNQLPRRTATLITSSDLKQILTSLKKQYELNLNLNQYLETGYHSIYLNRERILQVRLAHMQYVSTPVLSLYAICAWNILKIFPSELFSKQDLPKQPNYFYSWPMHSRQRYV